MGQAMVTRNQGNMPHLEKKNVQREMAETIKELKSSMPKPSEENEKLPQEESAAAGKGSEQKGPSFVTQEDVVAMLEKELSRSQEDWKYLPPPYPSSLLQQPYPKGYKAPTFVLFDGREGEPKGACQLLH
ncbi:unnamed protein product [Prunus brigantina]